MNILSSIKNLKFAYKLFLLIFFDIFNLSLSVYLSEIIYLGYVPPVAKSLILYFIILNIYYFFFASILRLYKQLNRFFGIYNIQNLLLISILITLSLLLTKKFIFMKGA